MLKVYTVTVDGCGSIRWYVEGKLHREDGPAYTAGWEDRKVWYQKGKIHRTDGPAIEAGFDKYWFLNNRQVTEDEFNARMNPVKELTVAEIEALLGYSVKVVK